MGLTCRELQRRHLKEIYLALGSDEGAMNKVTVQYLQPNIKDE